MYYYAYKSMAIPNEIRRKRLSITISPQGEELLTELQQKSKVSKSVLVEEAIRYFALAQLDRDTKILSTLNFSDLPTETEWLQVQSQW